MWSLIVAALLLKWTACIPPLQITAITCLNDEEICSQSYCFLAAKRPNLNWANFGFFVTKSQSSAFIQTQFYNKYGNNYEPVGPVYYENICDLSLVRSRSLAFVVMLHDMSVYASNFECPIVDNVTVSNLPPDIALLPRFVRTKDYKMNFSIGSTLTNKTFFSVSLYLNTTLV